MLKCGRAIVFAELYSFVCVFLYLHVNAHNMVLANEFACTWCVWGQNVMMLADNMCLWGSMCFVIGSVCCYVTDECVAICHWA